MLLEITDPEVGFLSELLDAKHKSLLHEINHTDTHEFRDILRQQVAVLEGLKSKIHRISSAASLTSD